MIKIVHVHETQSPLYMDQYHEVMVHRSDLICGVSTFTFHTKKLN